MQKATKAGAGGVKKAKSGANSAAKAAGFEVLCAFTTIAPPIGQEGGVTKGQLTVRVSPHVPPHALPHVPRAHAN